MSQTTLDAAKSSGGSGAVPAWIASGIIGLALGAAGMYMGQQFVAKDDAASAAAAKKTTGRPGPGQPGGGPAMGGPGMGGGGMGAGMAGGGMGGGMGGGGGFGGGGGGGGAGKRNLTALVGKLELLSRADLKLHVELDPEQAKKVAAKLDELEKAEKMTGDEAQGQLDALEAILTDEQKTTLGLVSLPFGRGGPGGGGGFGGGGGGGGGRGGGLGAAGRPGAGGRPGAAAGAGFPPPPAGAPPGGMVPPMAMGGGGGMGGGNADENPFSQEANQKRLKDLLARLSPEKAGGTTGEPAAKPVEEKPAEEKPAESKDTEKNDAK